MKICFLYESVFTLGGVQRCITILSNYLVNKGYDISVICTNTKVPLNRETYGLDEKVKVIFIKKQNIFRKIINRCLQLIRKLNYRTGILKKHTKILDYVHYYYYGKYIQKIVDKEKFDIIIGCGEYAKLTALMSSEGMKKIGWQHSTYDAYFNSKNKFFWNEDASIGKMFKILDKYIVLTLDDKIKLKKLKNLDSQTIYNPICFKQEEKSKLENKKFLALGRFNKVKGFDSLINNFKEFNKINKEWTLDIAGDGPERKKLEKQVKDLKLEKYVNLLHRKNNVKETYKQASIYCMTSHKEGFPLVVLEAIESGLPVIAYDIPCIQEIFVNGNEGIIIENRDDKKYVQAMMELANNKSKREKIANRAVQRAKDFRIENIGKQWENLFNEIME